MIHNVPKPDISDDFTIDDIHKIREWHYERLKDATREERIADLRERTAPIIVKLEAAKAKRREKAV